MFYTLLYKFTPNLSINVILIVCTAFYALIHYILFNGIINIPIIQKYFYCFYALIIVDLVTFLYLYKKDINETLNDINDRSQQLDEIIQKNELLNKNQYDDYDELDQNMNQQTKMNNIQSNMMQNVNPTMMQQHLLQQMYPNMGQQVQSNMMQNVNPNMIQQNNQQQKKQMVVQPKEEINEQLEDKSKDEQEQESIVIEKTDKDENQSIKETIINNDDNTSNINESENEIDGESITKN